MKNNSNFQKININHRDKTSSNKVKSSSSGNSGSKNESLLPDSLLSKYDSIISFNPNMVLHDPKCSRELIAQMIQKMSHQYKSVRHDTDLAIEAVNKCGRTVDTIKSRINNTEHYIKSSLQSGKLNSNNAFTKERNELSMKLRNAEKAYKTKADYAKQLTDICNKLVSDIQILKKSLVSISEVMNGQSNNLTNSMSPIYETKLSMNRLVHLQQQPVYTMEQFETLYKSQKSHKFAGCYVIYDTITSKYYVGQSINVYDRIHQHIKGRDIRQPIDEAIFVDKHPVLIKMYLIQDLEAWKKALKQAYMVNNSEPYQSNNNVFPLHADKISPDVYYHFKTPSYSVAEILELYKKNKVARKWYVGCFIIHDATTNAYDIQDSKNILNDIKNYLPKHNISNNSFNVRIRLIVLEDLNELEKEMIGAYDSVAPNGYNKTKGNG